MQVNVETITKNTNTFITPEAMLKGLITSLDYPCNCGSENVQCECEQQQLNEDIKNLQAESNNIRSEIVQVQHLLQARDQLYTQLDQLRQERDSIENQIETSSTYEHTQTVKCSGFHQMNERLRRRIYQVREYIQKMTFENQKIEEGLISNQYQQQQEEVVYKRREMQSKSPVYEGRRQHTYNVENIVEKIHDKQEQAWRRVRRQEDDISRRNMESRMRKTGVTTFYSPKARTYYSPHHRQIY